MIPAATITSIWTFNRKEVRVEILDLIEMAAASPMSCLFTLVILIVLCGLLALVICFLYALL